MQILKITDKNEEEFLRRKTVPFDFNGHGREEISKLIKDMRLEMEKANGVGLSANQIGLDFQVFVARANNKFYAIFNPQIIKISASRAGINEGCLSVPKKYSEVFRPDEVILIGQNKTGKKIKLKASGILARIFQHEVDHLNGKLFIDHLHQ
jgi:peptide deformylase